MKINSLLQEGITAASSPENAQSPAPKFGRSDKFLEEKDEETVEECTTAGSVATVDSPVGGMQRRGKGSIFAGIKTSDKYPNSKAVKEGEEFGTFSSLKDWQVWNVHVYNNFYRGKYADYGPRPYSVVASSPEEARQVVIDNADYVLQDLLSRKLQNGKKVLPRGSALPIEDKRVGKAEPGSITTVGFKEMLTPEGPMSLKFSGGKIVASQDEQSVDEARVGNRMSDISVGSPKIVNYKGKAVGEVGIDHEPSPGNGPYYWKHYLTGKYMVGYDTKQQALADLKDIVMQYEGGELEEGLGADTAKLLGIPVVAGALAVGAGHLDKQQPHVEIGGQSAKIIHADSTMMPRDTMLLKGSDGKMYHVWMTSGKGAGHALLASPAEEIKEAGGRIPSGLTWTSGKLQKRPELVAAARAKKNRDAAMKRKALKVAQAVVNLVEKDTTIQSSNEPYRAAMYELGFEEMDGTTWWKMVMKAIDNINSELPQNQGVAEGHDYDDDYSDFDYRDEIAQLENQIKYTKSEALRHTLYQQLENMKRKYGVEDEEEYYGDFDDEGNRIDEKSKSQAQFRTMAAVAHNPEFAKKVGIKQSVGKEFHKADKKQDYSDLPEKVDEAELAEEMLANQLYRDLQIYKQSPSKDLSKKSKDRELANKPKDKEVQKK